MGNLVRSSNVQTVKIDGNLSKAIQLACGDTIGTLVSRQDRLYWSASIRKSMPNAGEIYTVSVSSGVIGFAVKTGDGFTASTFTPAVSVSGRTMAETLDLLADKIWSDGKFTAEWLALVSPAKAAAKS